MDGVAHNGDRLHIAKGSHLREQLNDFGGITGITIDTYGSGDRPIIDGSRIISAVSWTVDPSHANVYYADVTHEIATVPHATDANHPVAFHVAAWEDETLLTGLFDGADIAANRALVAATPGTFTVHLQGSADKDPRNGTGGTAYRYYVHLSDGGNPASNGAEISYAEQQAAALLATGGTYRGLEFRRSAGGALVVMADGVGGFCAEVSDCVFRDSGSHAAVIRPALLENCYAYGRTDGRSRLVGGYAWNFYYGQAEEDYTPPIVARNNRAEYFNVGLGSHGGANNFPVHDSVTLEDNTIVDCNTSIEFGTTVNGTVVDGHVATNCNTAVSVADSDMTLHNLSYLSPTSGTYAAISLSEDATIEDSSFVFRGGTGVLAQNLKAQVDNDPLLFFALTLNRVSSKGGVGPTNARYAQLDLFGSNSVLGKLSTSGGADIFRSIVMANSYLSERSRTIAEMEADNATLTDCLSPWRDEPVTDHSAADLIWAGSPDTTGIAILDAASPLYALGMGRQA